MATGGFLSLIDVATRTDPDGAIAAIAEMLSQCNEIFDDMIWVEGNLATGWRGTLRTTLPQGTFRMLYQGAPYTKSTTMVITEECAELVAYSQVDRTLANLNGNVEKVRETEDSAHIEGLSQQMATTIFYGNSLTNPTQFTGFSPRYNTTTTSNAANAVNVLSAGGTASSNASIWLIGWGENTIFGTYPKASTAGLIFEDKGDLVPGFDGSGNRFEAYTSYFRWQAGVVVKDWRYAARICNIDVTTAGLAGTNPPDLFSLMSQLVVQLPTTSRNVSGITKTDAPDEVAPGTTRAWYVNRNVRKWMDIQAIRDRNVLISLEEFAGKPVMFFREDPIRIVDALSSSETTVV
jgi:hypothetical protein